MGRNTFVILPTKPQFKWLADQLRASRAVIALCQKSKINVFSNNLTDLLRQAGLDPKSLSSYVNAGMRGFAVSKLAEPMWNHQFQYRASNGRGIKQYTADDAGPDGEGIGDLYIPAMAPDTRLRLADMDTVWDYPIPSIIFRLDATVPSMPVWWATLHVNTRPTPPKKGR